MNITNKEIKEIATNNVKYEILTKWLLERLENHQEISTEELERLMSALDFEIRKKTLELGCLK
ncbi:MAG: hypothetical protein IJ568_05395 [Bacilli bacterium]|nr:hypothetical protein [Bacilli bacterium]